MEVRPGYKHTEVGVIPQDWGTSRMKDMVQRNAPIAYGVLKPGDYVYNGIPLLQIRDVIHGDIDVDQLHCIGNQLHEQYSRTRLKGGEIVVSLVGTIGKVALIPITLAGGNIHRNLARVLLPQEFDRVFVFYYLNSDLAQAAIKLATFGSTQALLNLTDLRELKCAVPPLPEQRDIAAALSDVDALLGGLDRLIAKNRDLKQAAMQQLLTGQTRLPGFSGEWAKMRISEMCQYVNGVRTVGGDVGYVEIGDIDVELKSYSLSQKEKRSVPGSVKVPAGTLLISTVRPTRGAIAVTQSSLYVSSAFCRLQPASDLLFHLVCQPIFLAYLGENSIGGTYPTCRDETILNYEAVLPCDPAEQAAIAAVLSDMDAELAALESRRGKTRDLKLAMMQELLTGRTRLVTPGAAHA
ncbi:restriction endonuclease subunit S [Stenotrophomonas maltophilia]|nr:restriction endonuclease subunit S [Stenotrophomonas maltophilia]WQI22920.1 restriction endonuclease subunit S [Stenotrophomonas maltophilia]